MNYNLLQKGLMLFLLLTCFCQVETSAQTSKNQVDDLIYYNVDKMLANYSWWRRPRMYYNQGCVGTWCGTLCSASYCSSDEVIAIPSAEVNFYYNYGDAAMAFVICHEMGHHIQKLKGTRKGESEADCAAGALMGSLVRNGYITLDGNDSGEMENLAWYIGDYCGGTPHGTPSQRVAALRRGCDLGMQYNFQTSFNQCIQEF